MGMSEFDIIAKFKSNFPPPSSRVRVGIGDDAAVIESPAPGTPVRKLLCSDLMIEGVHFDLNFMSVSDLAYKAVAATLSDIAAMNGKPTAVLISLALPIAMADDENFAEPFCEGLRSLSQKLSEVHIPLDIVGGDLSRSPSLLFIDIAVVGETSHPILRSGAKVGDVLAVSGNPGNSAAGLFSLQNQKTFGEPPCSLAKAHRRPLPRFDLSQILDPKTCHALIDISDGLASEAHHLAKESGIQIEINEIEIPLHPEAVAFAKTVNRSALEWALYGGEDYELLAAFAPETALPKGFTAIGTISKKSLDQGRPAVTLVKSSGERVALKANGYDHFR